LRQGFGFSGSAACFTDISPKFVWLRVGNCPAETIEELLRKHSVSIHTSAGRNEIAFHYYLKIYGKKEKQIFSGKRIDPTPIDKNPTLADLVDDLLWRITVRGFGRRAGFLPIKCSRRRNNRDDFDGRADACRTWNFGDYSADKSRIYRLDYLDGRESLSRHAFRHRFSLHQGDAKWTIDFARRRSRADLRHFFRLFVSARHGRIFPARH
jgi:hypothetical protein